jgi:hypothetical protein
MKTLERIVTQVMSSHFTSSFIVTMLKLKSLLQIMSAAPSNCAGV